MNNAFITLPIESVIELYDAIKQHDKSQTEIIQLKREVEGLRNIQHECMQLIGELRKKIK